MNSNKMFFLFILMFSTFISISSNSWLGCWIGLEINLLSFITIIKMNNNLINSEISLKYFLIQSIASMNFLFFILISMIFMKNLFMLSFFIYSSLLLKLGSVPFHFWFINIIEGLNWMNSFILFSWQKISPMILLMYYMINNNNFIFFIILMNIILGSMCGFNQISLRKLLAFSSINNLGWMLMSLMLSEILWMMYFFFYLIMIFNICYLFKLTNIFYQNQLFNLNLNFLIKINFSFNFLSLGGMPPFILFFPKWMIINFLMNNNLIMLAILILMFSLILFYLYFQIIYSLFMFNSMKIKWFNLMINNKLFYLLNILNFFMMNLLILCTFFFYFKNKLNFKLLGSYPNYKEFFFLKL